MNSVLELVLKNNLRVLSLSRWEWVCVRWSWVWQQRSLWQHYRLLFLPMLPGLQWRWTLLFWWVSSVCVFHKCVPLVVLSVTKCSSVMMQTILACASSTWAHSTHQTPVLQDCPCLQTLMSVLWTTATVNTTAPTSWEGTAASVPRATSWARMDTTAQVIHSSGVGCWSLHTNYTRVYPGS